MQPNVAQMILFRSMHAFHLEARPGAERSRRRVCERDEAGV
jgi:hypothetical protein